VSNTRLRVAGEPSLVRFAEYLAAAEGLVPDLSLDEIPVALGRLGQVSARLTFRALSSAAPPADCLLSVVEAAGLLGMAEDTLYRRSAEFPFTVRDGRRVRFSRRGIETFIRSRAGR
jgi:predicted DNA-binding transcriptional regulator AlpA